MAAGGRVLVECAAIDGPGHFITPGVVEVDRFTIESDCEIFGPLVQVAVVDGLDEAIAQANATRYGLAASIFTRDDAAAERFFAEVRAGCVNRNTGTAGASSKLPFGGLGLSGNHRPAAAFSVGQSDWLPMMMPTSMPESAPTSASAGSREAAL